MIRRVTKSTEIRGKLRRHSFSKVSLDFTLLHHDHDDHPQHLISLFVRFPLAFPSIQSDQVTS